MKLIDQVTARLNYRRVKSDLSELKSSMKNFILPPAKPGTHRAAIEAMQARKKAAKASAARPAIKPPVAASKPAAVAPPATKTPVAAPVAKLPVAKAPAPTVPRPQAPPLDAAAIAKAMCDEQERREAARAAEHPTARALKNWTRRNK